MKKLNVAVVGTGSWGKNHARIYSELPYANLFGIVDKDLKRGKAIAKQYNTQFFENLDDLLKNKELHMIAIASPTTSHAKIAIQAIEYGKHVFIEKPMTGTVDEALEVMDAEKTHGIKIGVGFIERFNPVIKRSKQLVENKELGNLVLMGARRLGPFWPERLKDVDVIRDVSIHDIDGFRFIIGKEPISIYARGGKLRHHYYDYAEIILDFGSGVTGFIESNYLTPHKYRKLSLTCEHGMVEADFMTQEYIIENEEFIKKRKLEWQEPLSAELGSFVKSCLEDSKPLVTSEDGLRALQISYAAIESIETHKVININ